MPPAKQEEVLVFLIAANVIVAGFVVFSFFVLRTHQKRKILHRQQLLEKELKTREDTVRNISRDLHDEIGSSLSGINLFAQMTDEQLKKGENNTAVELLQKIKNYSEVVIEKTGDLVWMLQPENDTQEKMLQRLKSFAESLSLSRQVKLEYQIDPDFLLPHNQLLYRKNIYLICKEAINNAIKHSECTLLQVTFRDNIIHISDNGKGFDPEKIAGGYGLKNIEKRAAESGIQVKIQSQPLSGVSIQLLLSGSIPQL